MAQLVMLFRWIVSDGGTVIIGENDPLFNHEGFWQSLSPWPLPAPNLRYANRPAESGLYIMRRPSRHWLETVTGLGATGVNVMLATVEKRPLPGHPFIPLLQVTENQSDSKGGSPDFDLVLTQTDQATWAKQMMDKLQATLSGRYVPSSSQQANVDFQVTRGILGVSL